MMKLYSNKILLIGLICCSLYLISCGEKVTDSKSEEPGTEPNVSYNLEILSGDDFTASVVGEVNEVALRVTDEEDNPVSDYAIDWKLTEDDTLSSLIEYDTETNEEGLATAQWELGASVHEQVLSIVSEEILTEEITSWVEVNEVKFGADSLILWTSEESKIVELAATDVEGNDLFIDKNRIYWIIENDNIVDIQGEEVFPKEPGMTELGIEIQGEKYSLKTVVKRHFKGNLSSFVDIDFTNSKFIAYYEGKTDTAEIQPDGTFSLKLNNTQPAKGDGLYFVWENSNGERSNFHPSWFWEYEYFDNDELSIVLFPTNWIMQRGNYKGQELKISLNDVLDTPDDLPTYYGASFHYWTDYSANVQTIPIDNFPFKVGFWHSNSPTKITKEDSLAFWKYAEDMEAALGLNLFEPIADPGWKSASDEFTFGYGEIMARLDNELGYGGLGGGSCRAEGGREGYIVEGREYDWWYDNNTSDWSKGATNEVYLGECTIHDGGVTLKKINDPRYKRVVQHELLHAIGLGHGCNFPSIQGECPRTNVITKEDAIYWEYLTIGQDFVRSVEASSSIYRAFFGQRKEMGLEPIPDLNSRFSSSKANKNIYVDPSIGLEMIPWKNY